MLLRHCRTCECYLMDDGREVSCRFSSDIAYYEIKPATAGARVGRCPLAGQSPRRAAEKARAERGTA